MFIYKTQNKCCVCFGFFVNAILRFNGIAKKLQLECYWDTLIADDLSDFGSVTFGNGNSRRRNRH